MAEHPVCLGLDVGTRRIGVSVHAPGTSYAVPLETVDARREGTSRVVELLQEREVEVLVVGWPLDMDGAEGRSAKRVQKFLDELATACADAQVEVEVVKWDERLTTVFAESILVQADVSRAKRKKVVDQIAAVQILESYLQSIT